MDHSDFIYASSERWAPIPGTSLECANTGRIRYADSRKFYGELIAFNDLPAMIEGRLPVWDSDAVNLTSEPSWYFLYRSRDGKPVEPSPRKSKPRRPALPDLFGSFPPPVNLTIH